MKNAIIGAIDSVTETVQEAGDAAMAMGKELIGMRPDPINFDAENVGKAVNSAHSFLNKTLLGGGFRTSVMDAEVKAAEAEMQKAEAQLEKVTAPA